jgi:hypothetical protein
MVTVPFRKTVTRTTTDVIKDVKILIKRVGDPKVVFQIIQEMK